MTQFNSDAPHERLKDKVRVNGQVEVRLEGSCYIEWWVSGRRLREATTREDAVECARHKSVELRAIRAGLIASPEPSPVAEAKTLSLSKPSPTASC